MRVFFGKIRVVLPHPNNHYVRFMISSTLSLPAAGKLKERRNEFLIGKMLLKGRDFYLTPIIISFDS